MKRLLFPMTLLLAACAAAENVDTLFPESFTGAEVSSGTASAFPVRLVHPAEGVNLPLLTRSFVYGWAEPGGKLTVNGESVDLYKDGGWLTMVDYVPGPNTLHLTYEKTGMAVSLDRSVTVGAPAPMGVETIKPDRDLGLMPGETVTVSFHGPSGGRAFFTVAGAQGKFPMEWADGVYRGFFAAREGVFLKQARIQIHYRGPSRRGATKDVPGRLTVLDPARVWVVEVSTEIAILKAGPGLSPKDAAGYVMFPPPGVRFRATGFRGDEVRVRLTRDRELWIARNQVQDLSPATPPPQAVTESASVHSDGNDGDVRLAMSQKAPFEVEADEDMRRIEVRFFQTFSNTDWVHLKEEVPWIRRVTWSQDTSDVFRLIIETDEVGAWGYDARYEGNTFVLQLRRPPPMSDPRHPLKGLTVVVDAGHSPDTGAVSVIGVAERDVNILIAKILKEKLEADQATVYMMRKGDEPVPLYERPRKAWAARADILISIHNNALGDLENPLEKNGFGVYYFQPQALPLARAIHKAYQDLFQTGKNELKIFMKDDGLHWGNLALPRTPQMPAVLTESAYMIYPPEDWALRQPEFQADCAEAMRRGLIDYVKTKRVAAPRKAAGK